MLNLRDLIYGADPSRVDQNNLSSVGLSSDGNVFDQVSNDDDYRYNDDHFSTYLFT